MADEPAAGPAGQPGLPASIDTSRPHQARIYDYWLGGTSNFAVDREAAERALAAYPGLRRGVRAQRAFLASAVGYLSRTAGVRQFLDIGTGSTPGTTRYLDTDLRDTAKVLTEAAALLDFREPIAVLLIGVLQLIPDADDPHAIVTHLMQAVPPGSWLAIFHPASDIMADQMREVARRVSDRAAAPTTLRTRADVMRFFGGLEFLEPGLVQVHRWRPGAPAPSTADEVPGYAGLARKP